MQIEVKGLKEVLGNLNRIERDSLRANAVRRVLKKALQPMADDIRNRAPVDKGHLRDSIKIADQYGYMKLNAKTGDERFVRAKFRGSIKKEDLVVKTFLGIDPYYKPNSGDHPLIYANLIEYGSENYDVKYGPQPFFRPGWDAGKNALIPAVLNHLGPEIDKVVKRSNKKAAK